MATWEKELEYIASIISGAPLEKTIKWGVEVFTFNGRNVVSYGGFKNHFAIWFYNGVFLKDKYEVLVNAQEGKTKAMRQWRFTAADQIDQAKIMEYINEAIEIEKKGLKVQPEKFTPLPVPELLQEEFKNNEEFQSAFKKLTPGKQKEYILYLNTAKQEATKLKRLEKIKPMIMQGTGLHDRYK